MKKLTNSLATAIIVFGNLLPTVQTIADVVDDQTIGQSQTQSESVAASTESSTESNPEEVEETDLSKSTSEVPEEASSSSIEVEASASTENTTSDVKSSITPFDATTIVNIPDPVLYEGLKKTIGNPFLESLTQADLESITKADLSDNRGISGAIVKEQITDLTGLEYATNLTELSINNHRSLPNINALRSLPNLKTLYAESTGITDLSAIEDMPALEKLDLSGTPISDFSPLLSASKIKEFKYDSFIYFEPNNYQLTTADFNTLLHMKELNILFVPNNNITDISAISGNSMITQINLDRNGVESLLPLTTMENLEILYLNQNNLSSLDELSNMKNLSILYADSNHIADLSNMKEFYEGMVKIGDHRGLQVNNQTITLPAVTAKVGETAIVNNPTVDINGQKMPISSISNSGVASPDNETIEFTNLPEGDHTITYKITYATTSSTGVPLNYSATITQPITILPADAVDNSSVTVYDSTIYVGDEWNAENNFDSATAIDGSVLDYTAFINQGGEVDSSRLNTSTAGIYQVDYKINGVTSTATITVKDRQTAVNVHDSTIYVGDTWSAEDNFDSALDKDGNTVDFSAITVGGQVDTSQAGSYDVTYTHDGVTSTATITVKDKQTAVNVHDSTIYVGDTWSAEDNFDSALDKDGNTVDFSAITVGGQVDTSQAGSYDVTYTHDGVTSTATISVKDKQTAVNVHDSTIYVGDTWSAEDNFDSALDKDGNTVDFSGITVGGQVDTSQAGSYDVTYTHDGVTSTATITVKDKQTAVNVHDSTIYVGDTWSAEDNFDSALDKDGNTVDFSGITVGGQVDTSQAGSYDVTYTHDGVTSTATITVKDKQTAVNVHDSTIYVGDTWSAEDNFDSALDKDGNTVDFSAITVGGQVDTSQAGSYDVTYTHDGVTSTATISVKDKQTAVNVHDSTIYVGDTWSAEDNFDSALDKDGNTVDFSGITVGGQVDTSQAGSYDVTYTHDGVTSTATITVKDKQTAVNVHDSTIYVGDTWSAEDNFDSALDKDGNTVDFSAITVGGQVDTSQAGSYDVTYTHDGVTSTATITVKDKQTAVNVHDSTIYVGDTWSAEDNFDSALDKDGNTVDFSAITVGGQVDTSQAGSYDVTYTHDGVTSTATISVKDKQTAVNVHDSTIYVGDTWSAEDNFDSALDKDGNTVDFSGITVGGQVDTSQAGSYDVTYTHDGVTSTATITVKDKQTAVNVHDSTIYVGDTWSAEDNFDSALDKDGNTVDFSGITVGGQVDTSQAGSYDVTYTHDGVTSTATITVKDKQTAVNVHDSTIYVGDTWSAEDNFDSALDKDGNTVDFSAITVGGQVDTSQAGSYDVTYTHDGVTSTATISVKDKQTAVNVHDSTIYVGDTWSAEDNFDSALDKDGNTVDFSGITVGGQVDTSQAGSYDVTYTHDGVTSTATITVKDKQTAVNVHDSTIYVGDTWSAEDNFDSALDKDGNTVDFSAITVGGQVDTSQAGSYDVTYTHDGVTSTATITVKDKQTAVNVHDSTIYVGDTWSAEDNFDSALDKDGNTIDFSAITVGGQVDTSQAGSYDVTYTHDGVTSTATITVKDKQTAVNVHDSTIYVGDTWSAEDNFDSALDKDGNTVDFSAITVGGQVDTSQAGSYDVTYTHDGVTSTATISVKDKQTAVNVHDSTIYVGDTWSAEDNFDSALDKDGNTVDFSGITVGGQVDTSQAGSYDVTYTHDGVTSTATITVKDKQTAVNVHDSTIYVGDTWSAEDNFDSALDKDGNTVDFSAITVGGQVDTSQAGSYDVTYTHDGVTSTATITVKDKQTAVNVHDSTIYVGDTWSAEDNFDSALDKDGNTIDFSAITVGGQVDTSQAGSYDVTYTHDGVTSTATITVKDKQTAVNVHDSTIYVGDTWNAEDNFDSALDKDGNTVDFAAITVGGQVDTSQAGSYDVTYTHDSVTSTARITVKDKKILVTDNNSTVIKDKPTTINKNDLTLPKTGEKTSDIATVLGTVMISIVGLSFWGKKRKKKDKKFI